MPKYVFGYHLGSDGQLFTHGLTVVCPIVEDGIVPRAIMDKMNIEMNKINPRRDRGFTYDIFVLEDNEEIPVNVLKHFIEGINFEEVVLQENTCLLEEGVGEI